MRAWRMCFCGRRGRDVKSQKSKVKSGEPGGGMHPLLMLYRLQMSALRRRVFRGLGSVKGAFLFVFGLVVVGLWVAPAVWSAHAGPRTDPGVVREVTPVILLSMCLLA